MLISFSYEIQLEKEYQHKGIGSKSLQLLENLAQK